MKIRPLGAEWSHADGQTDAQIYRHDDATSRFWQLCEQD
jgi:hypothetical protein